MIKEDFIATLETLYQDSINDRVDAMDGEDYPLADYYYGKSAGLGIAIDLARKTL